MAYVIYRRVSTQKQFSSGLGLDAQRELVQRYLSTVENPEVLAEFVEAESGKGADALDRRPQLRAALELCKKNKATLLIAKLDRLARNVHFVSGLIEAGVDFCCADNPSADKTMIFMFSVMAEWERDQIAARTRTALAAAKARGIQLGRMGSVNLKRNTEERQRAADDFARKLSPIITGFRAQGLTLRDCVNQLNALNISTAKSGQWSVTKLHRVMVRLKAMDQPAV